MADIELLTEHFGYPPVSLLDDIVNSVNILAERALNSVEQGLLNAAPATIGFKSKPPPNHKPSASEPWIPAEAAKNEIELGTHQLETLLCASIDRNLDKFELFVLRNFLCVQPVDIRDWMRLSHYEGLDFSELPDPDNTQQGSSNTPTLDSINALRKKLRESMRLNALLTAERERNARTLQKLQHLIVGGKLGVKTEGARDERRSATPGHQTSNTPSAIEKSNGGNPNDNDNDDSNNSAEKHGPSPFAFLQQKGTLSAAGGSTPLGTTTAFTLSQLQALRALSQSLSNVTPDLLTPLPDEASHSSKMDVDEEEDDWNSKSWRRQRTEYVEHATRRHLEIVHGLEFGKDGEVRDGEWQGEGRKLAHGEVEGLERVVGVLEREAAANPRPPKEEKVKKQVQVQIQGDAEDEEVEFMERAQQQQPVVQKQPGSAVKRGLGHNGKGIGKQPESQEEQHDEQEEQQEEPEDDSYNGPDENSVPVIPVRGTGGIRKPGTSTLLTTPKVRGMAAATSTTPSSRTRGKATTTPAGGRTPSMNSAQRSVRTTGRKKSTTPVREEVEEDLMDMS